jgi:hypothetical protein
MEQVLFDRRTPKGIGRLRPSISARFAQQPGTPEPPGTPPQPPRDPTAPPPYEDPPRPIPIPRLVCSANAGRAVIANAEASNTPKVFST